MQFLWKWVDELIGKGLETEIIFKFIYYAAARLVPLALPIAMLIASIIIVEAVMPIITMRIHYLSVKIPVA